MRGDIVGQHPRNIVDEAATGDVGEGFQADAGLQRAQDRFYVDAGGGEERTRQRAVRVEAARSAARGRSGDRSDTKCGDAGRREWTSSAVSLS